MVNLCIMFKKFSIPPKKSIKVNLNTTSNQALASFSIKMVISTSDSGRMMYITDKAYIFIKMEKGMRDI